MRTVAALFVRSDSIYKTMPGVDCWDIERDARKVELARRTSTARRTAHQTCTAA